MRPFLPLLLACACTDAAPEPPGLPADAALANAAAADLGLSACPPRMAWVRQGELSVCVDQYEAALVLRGDGGAERPWPYYQTLASIPAGWTAQAVGAAGSKPQAYISQVQAAAACQTADKRLCTLAEWLAACQGPAGTTYPYGNTYQKGACNEGRTPHPVVELFGAEARFDYVQMNDPRLDQLPNTVAEGGAFARCVSAHGVFDLHGNLHEWIDGTTPAGKGIFKGGFFVDARINGAGCLYRTIAHEKTYHDYSTGFRCCATPTRPPP